MIEMRNFSRTGEIQMPGGPPISADAGSSLTNYQFLLSPQVPVQFTSGFMLTVPVMDTTRYLDYLARRLLDAGGSVTEILSSIISRRWIASTDS